MQIQCNPYQNPNDFLKIEIENNILCSYAITRKPNGQNILENEEQIWKQFTY